MAKRRRPLPRRFDLAAPLRKKGINQLIRRRRDAGGGRGVIGASYIYNLGITEGSLAGSPLSAIVI